METSNRNQHDDEHCDRQRKYRNRRRNAGRDAPTTPSSGLGNTPKK